MAAPASTCTSASADFTSAGTYRPAFFAQADTAHLDVALSVQWPSPVTAAITPKHKCSGTAAGQQGFRGTLLWGLPLPLLMLHVRLHRLLALLKLQLLKPVKLLS